MGSPAPPPTLQLHATTQPAFRRRQAAPKKLCPPPACRPFNLPAPGSAVPSKFSEVAAAPRQPACPARRPGRPLQIDDRGQLLAAHRFRHNAQLGMKLSVSAARHSISAPPETLTESLGPAQQTYVVIASQHRRSAARRSRTPGQRLASTDPRQLPGLAITIAPGSLPGAIVPSPADSGQTTP
jgi:hypothetical protein